MVATTLADERLVTFWAATRSAAGAFYASAGDKALTFRVEGGQIIDNETGSGWAIGGLAASGPLDGTRLEAVAEAFVAYWFAWAAFYPKAQLWTAPRSGGSR